MFKRMFPLVAVAVIAAACAKTADETEPPADAAAPGAVITGEDMVTPPAADPDSPVVTPAVPHDSATGADTTATDTPAH